MVRPRVLLAEDFDLVARQLRDLLTQECDVIGIAHNGADLIEKAVREKPDGIVADISMPGIDGLSAITRIRDDGSKCWFVFVSIHTELEMVRRAIELGALGYVSKLSAGDDLLPAIRAATRGHRFVSPVLSVRIEDLSGPNEGGGSRPRKVNPPPPKN